jgi:hypothetical protein
MNTSRILLFCLLIITLASCHSHYKKDNNPQADGLELAMLQEFRMTRDPRLNYVPVERMVRANSYMESLLQNGRPGGIAALTWQERGPNNIGGRTRAILIDKRDATGNTVFAGSVSGGLWKTTNFLSASPTWTVINDFLPNLAITCLVQDNTNQNTLYAGTGEGWFNVDAVRGRGIYKSTDGGNTWTVLPSTIVTSPSDSTFEYVQDMVIDNNGNLYCSLRNLIGASRGVKRSTNGGSSWVQVLGAPLTTPVTFTTGRASDLEVASNGDVYACLGILGKGSIWKSAGTIGANTGALGTWTEVTPPWVVTRQRIELAIAPSDPQRLYAFGQDSATTSVIGLWRSTNGGASWDSVGAPAALNNGSFSQTWYNLIAAVDPNDANSVIAGGLNLAKSTNGGTSWATITSSGTVHVDHHALVFDGSSKLINGNDGGIYLSSDINTASPSFVNKNNGYNITQFYGCDIHPSTVNYFLAGSQDNGTQKFTTTGINSTNPAAGGDGGFPHIDQSDGQLQIISNTANNYLRSTNGGASFSSLGGSINNNRGQFINPTDLDDVSKVLYAGDDAGRYYCITGLAGTPSAFVVNVAAMGTRELTAVKVDPSSANTIWIGASFGSPVVAPSILKLSNANTTTPTVLGTTTLTVPAGAAISSIDIDPANSNHILVTLSSFGVTSVFESTNGGVTFSSIEGNLPDMPVRWGMFAPANAELNGSGGGTGGILLGTELGVWTTSEINGTATQWIPNNNGLANVRTDMLRRRPTDNTVAAATHGRGLFTTILPSVVTGTGNPGNTKDFIKYISAENNNLLIAVGNLQTKTMTLTVYSSNGQLVKHLAGRYENTSVGISRLANGVYTIRITGDKNENYVRQFVK